MLDFSKLFMTGSLLVAFTGGAYVLFGTPTTRRNRKIGKGQCRGLINVGNSCFLNALLQAWAASPSLTEWLRESLPVTTNAHNSLAQIIFSIIKVLNREDDDAPDPYDGSKVLSALRARRWVISSEEQDAHELFHVLTETLEEETAKYPRVLSLFDVGSLQHPNTRYQPQTCALTRSKSLLPKLPVKSTEQPTRGFLASQLNCLNCCRRYPVKYDVFDSLSLNFPRNFWGPISLDMMLRSLVLPEVVEDVTCDGCKDKSPTGKSTFRKRVSIGKLPQVLCIHLHRTQWLDNGMQIKRSDHVKYTEILQMDKYLYSKKPAVGGGLCGGTDSTFNWLSQNRSAPIKVTAPLNLLRTLNFDQQFTRTGLFVAPQKSPRIPDAFSDVNHNASSDLIKANCEFSYRLVAVICHLGDTVGGHFTSYRRGTRFELSETNSSSDLPQSWWYTSDSQVRRASLKEVLSAEAYILFYERM